MEKIHEWKGASPGCSAEIGADKQPQTTGKKGPARTEKVSSRMGIALSSVKRTNGFPSVDTENALAREWTGGRARRCLSAPFRGADCARPRGIRKSTGRTHAGSEE